MGSRFTKHRWHLKEAHKPMRMTYQEWLASRPRPIMGRSPQPASTGAGEETETEETPAGGEEETEETEEETSGEEETSEEDEVDDADADEAERIKRERDEARDQLAKAQAAVRKAKEEARKARTDAAKKGGNWEQVAREREAELAEANERAQNADSAKVEAENSLDDFRREVRINRLANKLSFRDSEDAMAHLRGKPELTGDDKSCERALRKLAADKPYLIDQKRARGRAMGGSGNGSSGGPSYDQLKGLSEDEVNANWDQISGTLKSGPGG